MENKKTEKADLENKKAIFFQIGLVLILGLTLFAFEWKSYDKKNLDQNSRKATEVLEEIVLQTQQNTPPPPPPPQQQNTVLEIVENDEVIENEVSIDAEADQKTVVEEYHAPVSEEKEVEETEIFTVVEESPGFPGGDEARIKFLQENIKYPTMARESGIQGTVYVTFVIEKGGNVSDVKILRGIGGGCDEEAIRVIRAMPRWNPGKQRGKSVRVQFNMPIKFTLAG